MTSMNKLMLTALLATVATAGAHAAGAATTVAGEHPFFPSPSQQPVVGQSVERAAVRDGARDAIANHRFYDEAVSQTRTTESGSTVSREQVRAQAAQAVQQGSLGVGE